MLNILQILRQVEELVLGNSTFLKAGDKYLCVGNFPEARDFMKFFCTQKQTVLQYAGIWKEGREKSGFGKRKM